MPATFGVVDLFAGPGGLGEGFVALAANGHSPFQIGISVEKEESAHRTLTLRAFLREFRRRYDRLPGSFIEFHAGLTPEPDWSTVEPDVWRAAVREASCLELGTPDAANAIDRAIRRLRKEFDDTVLIGGPPCQAYSLVGRARARGKVGYVPEEDERHYLFREYIRVLERLRPAVFVMENVKGMLSSTVESRLVFEMLMEDLRSLRGGRGHHYELLALRVEGGKATLQAAGQPSDFIVRAEEFGVPQRRHRVIIVGVRRDVAGSARAPTMNVPRVPQTLADVLEDLPALRSGLSRGRDSEIAWREAVIDVSTKLARIHRGKDSMPLRSEFLRIAAHANDASRLPRSSALLPGRYGRANSELLRWIERPKLRALAQHGTRGHMPADLGRYLFASVFGANRGYSPKAAEFPVELSPDHRNWNSGVFNDRFRVQLAGEPSTTITSHISKDGHYFIHPDPTQCRSLTVREAARLQTFPDDYYFLGNRTQQYVQVGNAVPPYLAHQIARLVHGLLVERGA